MKLTVAAYYFPGYHVDPRVETWHGTGWTEWELVKLARGRYPGHYQPRQPEWGYFDEADPRWGARQAEIARASGVNAFLFDWYWYEGPFLQRALDEGFLGSGTDMAFALLWANHDWLNIHPSQAYGIPPTLLRGACGAAEFEALSEHVVSNYFSLANYLTVGGQPYFSIYDVGNFISGFGSVDRAAEALEGLRASARRSGLGGVHVNAVLMDTHVLQGEHANANRPRLLDELGIDSVGSYVWIHHYRSGSYGFPRGSYLEAAAANRAAWHGFAATFDVPYYPNVTVGWDSSPRACQSDVYEERDYPWLAVLEGNTPEAYRQALEEAKAFVASSQAAESLITINAWNEWTEGSYLLPDTRFGDDYLRATAAAFPELVADTVRSPEPNADEAAV